MGLRGALHFKAPGFGPGERAAQLAFAMSVAGAEVAAVQVVGVRRFWIVDGTPELEAMRASVGAYLFSDMAVKNATQ